MSKTLFFFLFPVLFLLLILSGGTFWSWAVTAVFTGFLVYSAVVMKSKVALHPLIQVLVGAAVIIQLPSIFNAASIPLALSVFFVHVFAYIVCIFFLSVDEKKVPTALVQQGLILVGAVLALLVIILTAFPALGSVIPSKSLLATSYGHNHASIFILMVFPFAWQFYLKQQSKLWWSTQALLSLGILLSFSRLNIALFFTMLGYLLLRESKHRKILIKKIWALLFIALAFVLFMLVASLSPQQLPTDLCDAQREQRSTKLCKPIDGEPRLYYWRQAIQGIQERPVWGWGGGSFELVSRKYRQEVDYFTAHPHNAYLEILLEFGVIGVLPLITLIVALGAVALKSLQDAHLEKFSETHALALSVLAFLADGVTDYNWSIASVWVLFWVCSALLLKKSGWFVKLVEKKSGNGTSLWYGLIALFTVWSFFVLVSGICRLSGNTSCMVRFFPFDERIAIEAYASGKLEEEHTEVLDLLYHNNVRYLETRLQEQRDEDAKIRYYNRIIELNPLEVRTRIAKIELLISEKRWNVVRTELDMFTRVFPRERYLSSVFDPERTEFIDLLTSTGNRLWYDNPDHAQFVYLKAAELLPWQFSQTTVSAFEQPSAEDAQYLHPILDRLESEWLWKYQDGLAAWYKDEALRALRMQDWQRVQRYARKAIELNPTLRWQIWDDFSPEIHHFIVEYGKSEEFQKQEEALSAWQNIYEAAEPKDGAEPLRDTFKRWLDERTQEVEHR